MDNYNAIRDPRRQPKRPREEEDFASNRGSYPPVQPERPPPPHTSSGARAPPPFDQPTSDAILRSSDSVDFRVRSAILIEASRHFRDLFAASSPVKGRTSVQGDISRDGLPILRCSENADMLDIILRLCYPIEDPDIKSPQALCDVLKVASKYNLHHVAKKLLDQFIAFADKEPLKMYMLACRRRWPTGIRIAARASLSRPIQAADLAEFEDLQGNQFISALELVRLQSYHKICGQVASAVIGNVCAQEASGPLKLPWLSHGDWIWFNCPHRSASTPVEKVQIQNSVEIVSAKWWTIYLRKAQEKLRSRPSGATVLDTKPFAAFAAAAMDYCSLCKRQVIEDLLAFNNLLAKQVEDAIEQVEFDQKPENI